MPIVPQAAEHRVLVGSLRVGGIAGSSESGACKKERRAGVLADPDVRYRLIYLVRASPPPAGERCRDEATGQDVSPSGPVRRGSFHLGW